MKEEQVYFVGGGAKKMADEETFVAAIRAACEAAGCRLDRFISALGPYGTWVAEIDRAGVQQRVLWNGKEQRLVLQLKLPGGGWEDPVALEVPEQNPAGFAERVEALLDAAPDSNK